MLSCWEKLIVSAWCVAKPVTWLPGPTCTVSAFYQELDSSVLD
jgi:hypothetical protein